MFILHKMIKENIFGFNYIIENKNYYIDLHCIKSKVHQNPENVPMIVKNIYLTEKKHLNKSCLEEREFILNECYDIIYIGKKFNVYKNYSLDENNL